MKTPLYGMTPVHVPSSRSPKPMVISPSWILLTLGLVAAAVIAVVVYRRANPPPIQFRSEVAVPYHWIVTIRCNGRTLAPVEGDTGGTEIVTVSWPGACEGDRILVQVDYIPAFSGCRVNSTSRYMVTGSPPLIFSIQCAPTQPNTYPPHRFFFRIGRDVRVQLVAAPAASFVGAAGSSFLW